jgi:hypothetical protein
MTYIIQYMQLVSQNLLWLAPFVAIIYVLFSAIKKMDFDILSPSAATIFFGLLAFLTFPTIPKYKFMNDVDAEFTNASEFKLVSSSSAFSIAEPLAYFRAPTTFFHYVAPMAPPASEPYSLGSVNKSFQELFYEYGKEPKLRNIEARCDDFYIGISEPIDGLMRYVDEREMYPIEINNYCVADYTTENNILNCKRYMLYQQSISELDDEQINTLLFDVNSKCRRDPS